jgi:hypothetical protein
VNWIDVSYKARCGRADTYTAVVELSEDAEVRYGILNLIRLLGKDRKNRFL